jgi:hypothetical protein
MTSLEQLQNNGFLLFRNVLRREDINFGYSCFSTDGKINYKKMKKYIEDVMLQVVNNNLGWQTDYVKFRVSDNNNSSDASTFHRDIIAQKNKLIPSYTCLSYLDTTVMEIIPGSHKNLFIPLSDIISTYGKRMRIQMNPGDILIFQSTMLHRGIFFQNNQKNRKLIQVFEVFPSKQLLLEYKDNFIHVEGKEAYSGTMQFLSKYSLPTYFLNWIGYINASSGYGKLPEEYLPDGTNCIYLSSEGLRGREIISDRETWQPQNRYVVKYETILLENKHRNKFNHYCYNRKFYITILLMILLFILLSYIIYKLIKRSNNLKK